MAQRLLVDVSDDAYLDNLLSYLNEGCRRFASETHCCQAIVDMNTNTSNEMAFSSIATAASAAKILYVAKIRLDEVDGTAKTAPAYLPKASMSEMKDLPTTSTTAPTRYSLFGEKVIFDLHPSATLDFDVTVYCSYIPSDLTSDNDTIVIPDQWISAIVQYMVYCCRVADRDSGLANGAWGDYEAVRTQAAAFYIAQSGI